MTSFNETYLEQGYVIFENLLPLSLMEDLRSIVDNLVEVATTTASDEIYEFLDDISLGNLVREPGVQQVAERQDSRRQGKEDNASRKVAFIHDELTPL